MREDAHLKIKGIYAIVNSWEKVPLCLAWGITLIQLRIKEVLRDEIFKVANSIQDLKKKYPFTFIINDDPVLAHQVKADGVHLGQEDMSVSEARVLVGDHALIGLSTHSLEQAKMALTCDIDYLALGAIFESPTKGRNHPVVGLEVLREVVSISHKPVVAIGGIHWKNYKSVLEAGANACAFLSGLE